MMDIDLDKDSLRVALRFLARATLKGEEVDAFVRVVRAIRGIIGDDEDDTPQEEEKT